MSAAPAIEVSRVSKRFRLGRARPRYRTIRETIMDTLAAPLRRLRGGPPEPDDTVWALRDVSFEVTPGEVLGIIGRNGAGKSTLLKVLSRITEPTEGEALIRGRIASLLEVGTGFHPELSGRENIYLNGAILGMRRHEVDRRFDEIVGFAEIARFLDTPVKHYSSGMYMRLAFAVAAHLEPEILMVDEVLAVGDAAFQKKCLGRMDAVATSGRTVLFVSHNMGALGRLCRRGLLLEEGRVVAHGDIQDVIGRYLKATAVTGAERIYAADPKKKLQLRRAQLLDAADAPVVDVDRGAPFGVLLEYEVREAVSGAHVALMLDRLDGTAILHAADIDAAPGGLIDRPAGTYRTIARYPGGILNAGDYQIRVGIAKYGGETYDYQEPLVFHLHDRGSASALGAGGQQRPGVLAIPLTWTAERREPMGERP